MSLCMPSSVLEVCEPASLMDGLRGPGLLTDELYTESPQTGDCGASHLIAIMLAGRGVWDASSSRLNRTAGSGS